MTRLSSNNTGDNFGTSTGLSTGPSGFQKLLYAAGMPDKPGGPMVSQGLSG